MLLALVGVLVSSVAVTNAMIANAAPTSPPPGPVVAPGAPSRACVNGEEGLSSSYAYGYYWSEVGRRWVQQPMCAVLWSGITLMASQKGAPGDTFTFNVTSLTNTTVYGPPRNAMSWSHPGTVVAGCTGADFSCTFKLGTVGQNLAEYATSLVSVSLPYFYRDDYPQIGCTPETPCGAYTTVAYSWVTLTPNWGQPTADFDVDVTGDRIDVVAISADPVAKREMTHVWTMDSEGSAEGVTATHRFARSGVVDVTLVSTTDDGRTATITKQVEIEQSPVTMELDPDFTQLAPGKTSTVDLVLTSTDPDASTTVTLDPALVANNGLFTITPPASAASPITVPPNGVVRLSFGVEAGDDLGSDTFRSAGVVESASGKQWNIQATAPTLVAEHFVNAVLTFDPDEVTLEEDGDGPAPRTINLHLDITNDTDQTLTDLVLALGNPGWQFPASFITATPGDVVHLADTENTDREFTLGDLAPHASTTLDIPVVVTDDGRIEWGGLIRLTPEDGRERTEAATKGKLTSEPKYLARFEFIDWPSGHRVNAGLDQNVAEPWNTDQIVKAGQAFGVLGKVKNLTTDQMVMADLPTTALDHITSAVFRGSADEGAAPTTDELLTAGLPYRQTLEPGQTDVVSAYPSTVEDESFGPGETFSSRFTVAPAASARNEDGSYPDAVPAKVLADDEGLTASAATMTPPASGSPNANVGYLGRFSIGYVEGGIRFVKGSAASIAWLLTKAPQLPGMSVAAGTQFLKVASRLTGTMVAVGIELAEMTPAQRSALVDQVTAEAVNFLVMKAPDTSAAVFEAVHNAVDQAIVKLMTLAMDDPGQFWESMGSFTASAAGEISIGVLTDSVVAKVMTKLRVGEGLAKAERFLADQAAAVGLKLEKGLAGIRAGTILTDELLAKAMGITRNQIDQMTVIAKNFGVNIYARSRGSRAIELIENLTATMKPYFIKPKSVNDIDQLFLGFERLQPDVVALRKPPTWAELSEKMAAYRTEAGEALTAGEQELVISRWKTRNKEWWGQSGDIGIDIDPTDHASYLKSERYKLESKNGKLVALTLETEGNLEDQIVKAGDFATSKSTFQLAVSPDDADALIPMLRAQGESNFKVVVGDVDLVAITYPDGTVPPLDDLIKIYRELQKEPLNMQHSVTLTWTNHSPAIKMLGDHVGPNAEPLLELAVSGTRRAVKFDPAMSFADGAYYKKGAQFLHMAGGEINPPGAYATAAALVWQVTEPVVNLYSPPGAYGADMKRSAPPTRVGEDGTEVLVDGVWQPGGASAQQAHQAEAIRYAETVSSAAAEMPEPPLPSVVGVQSAIDLEVAAGATTLPVLGRAALYPFGGAA
ncbi:MAG TPA: hypothetical protein PLV68_02840, partial [Ilumatobacteraceae bacterium]|nr:hypothetical protein [Ilumatobacteraceae bacterium]